jgi:hypothetical protein
LGKIYIDTNNGNEGPSKLIQEYKWKNYRVDVGVCVNKIEENERYESMVGAIEILHTHVATDEKKLELTRSNVAWVEIKSSDVLNLAKKLNKETPMGEDHHDIFAFDHADNSPKCMSCQTKGIEEDVVAMHSSESWFMSSKRLCSNPDALKFGKYYGLTVGEIFVIDKPYVRWLAGYTGKRTQSKPITITYDDDIFKKQPVLQSQARKIMVGICLLCYKSCRESWQNWCNSCYKNSA